MIESQINAFSKNIKISSRTTFYNTESGKIVELSVQESKYISEGILIIQLADLSTLWAEAQVYTSHFTHLNTNSYIVV